MKEHNHASAMRIRMCLVLTYDYPWSQLVSKIKVLLY